MQDNDPGGDAIRVHIDRTQPLPDPCLYLLPPCFDADGNRVYFGSATIGNAVLPCKVTLKVDTLVCVVPHRLVERIHQGSFTILPFTDAMELVPTSHGCIPAGYRPVVGGVDENGRPLYHAVAWVGGERVPGRTSAHLGAAAVLSSGREHYVYDAHEILCWRDDDVEHMPTVSEQPEEILPVNDVDQVSTVSDHPRPGEYDLAGIRLRVTVSDLSIDTPTTDLDGTTPLYFGSALLHNAVLPGKIVEMRTCQVLQDDTVVELVTGFSVLPFHDDMELVPTSRGVVPRGRRPVEGNYDERGRKLYHAMLYVIGRQFPGMCAEHVGGAQGILQGKKYTLETGYTILCWKEEHTNLGSVPADPRRDFSYRDDLAGERLRIPLNGNEPLTMSMTQSFGPLVYQDRESGHPWFFASALHDGYVIPCWAHVDTQPCKYVSGDERVMTCTGPYCVLPFMPNLMELIWASNGKIPDGRTPVVGGRDEHGRLLYHVVGSVADGGWMIGMAADHLGGDVIVCQFGGVHRLTGYELLWAPTSFFYAYQAHAGFDLVRCWRT